MDIIERITIKHTREVELYKISGLIWEALIIRGEEPMISECEQSIFIHGFKVVRYKDKSTRVFDMSSDREHQIRNVWMLCMTFERIWSMSNVPFFDAPETLFKMKHTPY